MKYWTLPSLVLSLLTVILVASPAHAEKSSWRDPRGDAHGKGHDIVKVSVNNRRHTIKVVVKLRRLVKGNVAVGVQTKGTTKRFTVAYGRYRGKGRDGGSRFVDHTFENRRCPDFKVRWQKSKDRALFVVPRRCLYRPMQGKVRVWVLTENRRYTDKDEMFVGKGDGYDWSPWVARS